MAFPRSAGSFSMPTNSFSCNDVYRKSRRAEFNGLAGSSLQRKRFAIVHNLGVRIRDSAITMFASSPSCSIPHQSVHHHIRNSLHQKAAIFAGQPRYPRAHCELLARIRFLACWPIRTDARPSAPVLFPSKNSGNPSSGLGVSLACHSNTALASS